MIISSPEMIKSNEDQLIESIIENMDWKVVQTLVKDKFNISDIKCNQGDIIVHENKIAYKVNLEVRLDVDVLFDRDGQYISRFTENDFESIFKRNRDFWRKETS